MSERLTRQPSLDRVKGFSVRYLSTAHLESQNASDLNIMAHKFERSNMHIDENTKCFFSMTELILVGAYLKQNEDLVFYNTLEITHRQVLVYFDLSSKSD